MKNFKVTIEQVHEYVEDLLVNQLDLNCKFHNWNHTQEVVREAERLGRLCKLPDEDLALLKIAAYFHDTGHVSCYKDHEEASADIASEFLLQYDISKSDINTITSLIKSTKLTKSCDTHMQRILHDADLSHIGKLYMEERSKKLREEWEYFLEKKYTDMEWLELQIDFLKKLRFCTKPARQEYDGVRKDHVKNLKQQLDSLQSKSIMWPNFDAKNGH